MLCGRKLKLVHDKGQQYADSTAKHFLVMTHLTRRKLFTRKANIKYTDIDKTEVFLVTT